MSAVKNKKLKPQRDEVEDWSIKIKGNGTNKWSKQTKKYGKQS